MRFSKSIQAQEPPDTSLLTLINLFRKERAALLRITLTVAAVVTLYSFIMPQTFTSSVTILPPKKEETGSGIMDMLASGGAAAEVFDLGSSLGFGGRPSDYFVRILTSRTVADSLILDHRLADYFGISPDKPWRLAEDDLREATKVDLSKDGSVTVSVELSTSYFAGDSSIARVKNLAATLANEYVRLLDVVNREKLVSRARKTREYVQEQMIATKVEMDTAYQRLINYQESHRALMVDKQLDALVSAAGALKIQLAEATAELGAARRDLKSDSRMLSALEVRVDELRKQYAALQTGGTDANDFVLAFEKLPQVATDLARLMRTVKVLEEVNAFLNKQYYKERIQETRDVPTVQVLDEAIPAFRRTAPKRLQWMLMGLAGGLAGAAGFILVRASRRRTSSAGNTSGAQTNELNRIDS
jgi:uncharacterized protein involved in exopolysaccharide biosynthesis